MDLARKLNELIGARDQTEVAKAASISQAAMSAYISGKTKPSADAAVRLAKTLNIDLLWLLDDSLEWGDRIPKISPAELREVPADLLVWEMKQRYVDAALGYLDALNRLQTIDWAKAKSSLDSASPNEVPREAATAAAAYNDVYVRWSTVGQFAMVADLSSYPIERTLPAGTSWENLLYDKLLSTEMSIRKKLPDLARFLELLGRKMLARQNKTTSPPRSKKT